ncbi:MAG: hypothetical protein U5N26_03855 [Candidatus Marinimicrobia bacterium]|nr:hypothetical protein [Candidatus Neomarinimicrobiota bacterium]
MTAIEIALGNAAKYLVADSREDALDVIDALKHSQRGRVSIVPVDMMKERVKPPLKDPFHDKNILARAVDVVHADAENRLLIDYFLGNVLIVRSLRDLSEEALKDPRFRYVTPDGDYLDQRAMIRGENSPDGPAEHSAGRKRSGSSMMRPPQWRKRLRRSEKNVKRLRKSAVPVSRKRRHIPAVTGN